MVCFTMNPLNLLEVVILLLTQILDRISPLIGMEGAVTRARLHYHDYTRDYLMLGIEWWRHQKEHFPRYWPFVRGIRWILVDSPHKGQWRRALVFSLISVWTNDWFNKRNAGELRHHRAHNDVTAMGHLIKPAAMAKGHHFSSKSTQLCYNNISMPRQNCCHFSDNIPEWVLLNANGCILIQICLKFVPMVQ